MRTGSFAPFTEIDLESQQFVGVWDTLCNLDLTDAEFDFQKIVDSDEVVQVCCVNALPNGRATDTIATRYRRWY